jgi:saccharopine dehydrogenase-like NADP-dependent oxidoreductase
MRVVLMGAGHIGHTIASFLSGCGNYQIRVVDRSADALKTLSHLSLQTAVLDTANASALRACLVGQEVVINALPYHLASLVANEALAAGCHYFDLTEDVSATRAIMRLAEGANTALMPQCGLAPGFIGIVAHHLSKKFSTLHEVKMRVGALPAFPTNSLKYNLTWSVDGLINEYCHPCEAIRDGEIIEVLPLEGLEHFSLDGTEYEAFNTSGGLGTLCETLRGRVQTLDYKTVRYPGHCDIMKMLLQEMGMKSDQETLKDILRRSIPLTMQDVVLVFVTVSGERAGKFVQEVFARKIFADRNELAPLSAIQITTAAGICAAVDLFREGKLPQSGFIRQEQIELPDFLANRFGRAYQQSRQVESIG